MAQQLKRGLDSARTGYTPVEGELIYTTDTKKLYVGDGTTAGGNIVTGSGGGGSGYDVSLSTSDPSSSPSAAGDIYINTNNDKVWIAKGTSSVNDWIEFQSSTFSTPYPIVANDGSGDYLTVKAAYDNNPQGITFVKYTGTNYNESEITLKNQTMLLCEPGVKIVQSSAVTPLKYSSSSTPLKDVVLENIDIDMNNQNAPGILIEYTNSSHNTVDNKANWNYNITFNNVKVSDSAGDNIKLVRCFKVQGYNMQLSGATGNNLELERCTVNNFYNLKASGSTGSNIYLNKIKNCTFVGCTAEESVSNNGFLLAGESGVEWGFNTFLSCTAYNNGGVGFKIQDNDNHGNTFIAGCKANDNGSHGFHITGSDLLYTKIGNSYAINNGGSGIFCENGDRAVIMGNQCRDNSIYGIRLNSGFNNSVVVANQTINNTSGNISNSGSSNEVNANMTS